MVAKVEKMRLKKEISEKEATETIQLATEIQKLVLTKDLQPTVTTRYTRTAFQNGRDSSVRMSLDTNLHMILEHGYENDKWGRDLGIAVKDTEVHHFSYAILEVKLNQGPE
jgi:SPX domain protein involved in polyphosphate accumulation